MPRFSPDFTKVDASIPVYEKGRYQVKVAKHTPFIRTNRDGNVIAGVRYALEMIGKYDEKGKLVRDDEGRSVSPYTVWLHTEGGWAYAKPFLMAAAGYKRNDEATANDKLFGAFDFGIDGEPGEEEVAAGDGFDQILDQIVDVNLDKEVSQGTDGQDYINQEFSGWSPPAK